MNAAGQEWYEYQKALIIEVDVATGSSRQVFEYVTPAEAGPAEDPAILFKSGTLVGDRLYVTTQTEVLVFQVPTFERLAYVSLPRFNDLHHVRPTPDGHLLIANTGLDTVLEVSLAGDVLREWNVAVEDTWSRFSPDVDYRRVKTTKPHQAHPNHVFYIGDEPWATRFQQRDAISLIDPSRRIDIGLQRIHDGVVHEGRVYFTTVDGKIVIADTERLEIVDVVDLTTLHPADTRLGWCRGILLEGDRIWVGFSRIRPTKFRENVGWVLRGFKRDVGTHIGCYDLASRSVVHQFGLEDSGLSAVFSVFAAPHVRP